MVKSNNNTKTEKLFTANLEDGIKKVKEVSKVKKRKFVESVDIAVNLGIDARQSDQLVKGSLLLPRGSGKSVRVVAFVNSDEQKNIALECGAVDAGSEDLISKIEKGFLDFDVCIATPDMMQKVSKVARKLGPRGLMPSPKNNTVSTDIKKAISEALRGRVNFKSDKSGIVHCLVGRADFEDNALLENAKAIIEAIKEAKPENAKGKFIRKLFFNTTMGPSVQIAVDSI